MTVVPIFALDREELITILLRTIVNSEDMSWMGRLFPGATLINLGNLNLSTVFLVVPPQVNIPGLCMKRNLNISVVRHIFFTNHGFDSECHGLDLLVGHGRDASEFNSRVLVQVSQVDSSWYDGNRMLDEPGKDDLSCCHFLVV